MRQIRKFLIISSYAPPAISGAPSMMYNILQHFPQGTYRILTSHFGIDNRILEKGNWLPTRYFYFDTPRDVTEAQRAETMFQKVKSFIKKTALLYTIGRITSLFYFPYLVVRRGKKIVLREKAELLLGYSDHGPTLLGTYLLHKRMRKPFFVFLYDLYVGNQFPFLFRIVATYLEPRIFREAKQIFVMNEALRAHYRKKYGRDAVVIHNSISIPPAFPQGTQGSEPYRIVFTGAVDWPQRQAIQNLIKALSMITVPSVQFWFYTPHTRSSLNRQGIFESERVKFESGMPKDMHDIQQQADILFVPLSFRTKHPLLIATSSPGKTYEYMVSGRPILVHAPHGSYIAEYAEERQFALVVDEDNPEKLKEAILRLLSDKELVERLVRNAWQTAVENHDAKKESEKFQQYFLR